MKEVNVESKSVAQAIEEGLKQMGMRRDQVEVTVLQEASGGILGFGAKPAKVVLREKRWGYEEPRADAGLEDAEEREHPNAAAATPSPRDVQRPPERRSRESSGGGRPQKGSSDRRPPNGNRSENANRGENGNRGGGKPQRERRDRPPRERMPRASQERREPIEPLPEGPYTPSVPSTSNKESEEAKLVLQELLKLLAMPDATVLAGWDDSQGRVRAEVVGDDARTLLGYDGSGLEALQFLTTLIVNRKLKAQIAVQVDALGHFKRKEERIIAQALKAVAEVKSSGRTFRLEAMEAPLRRLVHKTLAENPDVETVSEGEGSFRKVTIRPRKK